jgi:hypothetical protein
MFNRLAQHLGRLADEVERAMNAPKAISEGDPSRNEARHQTLLRLLAEERAKDAGPADWPNN